MARTVTGRTLGEIQCARHKMDAEGAKERWFFHGFSNAQAKGQGQEILFGYKRLSYKRFFFFYPKNFSPPCKQTLFYEEFLCH